MHDPEQQSTSSRQLAFTAAPEQFVGRDVGGGVGFSVAISKERGKVELLDVSHQHIEQSTRSKKIGTYVSLSER